MEDLEKLSEVLEEYELASKEGRLEDKDYYNSVIRTVLFSLSFKINVYELQLLTDFVTNRMAEANNRKILL